MVIIENMYLNMTSKLNMFDLNVFHEFDIILLDSIG